MTDDYEYEERAAIKEFDAGMESWQAEEEARAECSKLKLEEAYAKYKLNKISI